MSAPDKEEGLTTKGLRQRRFLEAYKEDGVISKAAALAGVSRRTHYLWMDTDPEYVKRFEDAVAECDDALMYEIRRRGLDLAKRDTVALIVALKIRGIFVERRELAGPGGGPIHHKIMSEEDKKIATRIATRRLAMN